MPYNLRLEGLLVEEEVTYATDPTPSATTEGVRVVGRIWETMAPEYAFPNKREDVVSNSLVTVAPAPPKGRIMNLDFVVELIGSGAAYASGTPVRPAMDALFRACGMSRTHVDTGGTESVSYALADSSHASCTIWAYAGGDLFKVVGCRGNWVWDVLAGGLGQVRFQMQGLLSTAPAETAVASITYDSVIPPAAVNMGLAIVPSGGGSWTPRLASMSVTIGNEVQRLDDVNSADGIESFEITSRAPRVTMSVRKPDLSDYTLYARALSQVLHTIDATLGSVQYNRVDLDIDAAYLMTDGSFGADNGFAAVDLEYDAKDLIVRFD